MSDDATRSHVQPDVCPRGCRAPFECLEKFTGRVYENCQLRQPHATPDRVATLDCEQLLRYLHDHLNLRAISEYGQGYDAAIRDVIRHVERGSG